MGFDGDLGVGLGAYGQLLIVWVECFGGVSLLLAAAVLSGKADDTKPRSWHVDKLRYNLEASGLK